MQKKEINQKTKTKIVYRERKPRAFSIGDNDGDDDDNVQYHNLNSRSHVKSA